jgi:phosphatidylinositol-3-phosphatase
VPSSTGSPGPATIVTALPRSGVPAVRHVWLFMFENHPLATIRGTRTPYLTALARAHGLAARMYGAAHPSLPNYLAVIGGSTFGCTNDECATDVRGTTLVQQLEAKHLTWAAYYGGLPATGYTGGDVDGYVQHHDPFVYFPSIAQTSLRYDIHPISQFGASLRHPASFTFVEGTNQQNMHNGDLGAADAFARTYIGDVLRSRAFADHGVVLVLWDESFTDDTSGCCGTGIRGGHIPLIVVASGGRPHVRSEVPHDTYSVLRTIEDGFGLPHLGHAGEPGTTPLREFWP